MGHQDERDRRSRSLGTSSKTSIVSPTAKTKYKVKHEEQTTIRLGVLYTVDYPSYFLLFDNAKNIPMSPLGTARLTLGLSTLEKQHCSNVAPTICVDVLFPSVLLINCLGCRIIQNEEGTNARASPRSKHNIIKQYAQRTDHDLDRTRYTVDPVSAVLRSCAGTVYTEYRSSSQETCATSCRSHAAPTR